MSELQSTPRTIDGGMMLSVHLLATDSDTDEICLDTTVDQMAEPDDYQPSMRP